MSCSSAIHTVNDIGTSVSAGSKIPFGKTIRRFGRYLSLGDEGIVLFDRGYYSVNCSICVNPSEAGVVQAQLCIDGDTIPGGNAITTAASAEDPTNITLISLVRLCERDSEKLLTAHLLNDGIVTNMSTVITKV